LERKWCSQKCADLAVGLGDAASGYWFAQARVANAQYDVNQYGGQKAETKLRQRQQEAANTKIVYDKAKDNWDASGCGK
jgi:hypothetical protein